MSEGKEEEEKSSTGGREKERRNGKEAISIGKEHEKQELWGRNREKLRKIKQELFFAHPFGRIGNFS